MPSAQSLPPSFHSTSSAAESGLAESDMPAMGGLLASRAFWVGGLVSALAWAALTVLLLG